MLDFIQNHGLPVLIIVFTIVSLALGFTASIFQALGKAAPGWIGTALDIVGRVLHFLNGNTSAAGK